MRLKSCILACREKDKDRADGLLIDSNRALHEAEQAVASLRSDLVGVARIRVLLRHHHCCPPSQADKDGKLQQKNQRLATFDSFVEESEKKISLLRWGTERPCRALHAQYHAAMLSWLTDCLPCLFSGSSYSKKRFRGCS